MSSELTLGPGAEFDAIREMLARWGSRAQGIGDDAAVVYLPRGDALVTSVDTTVEGHHFERGRLSARELGYRAVVAAMSDLAAMAARPMGMLIAITLPRSWCDELSDIADGIAEAADIAHANILGGNLSGGAELSIVTTVFGSAFAPLTRCGAQPGDRVYVTGRLGGPGVELAALLAGTGQTPHRERFVRPVPRIGEAIWLAARGATAAIDVSDGLVADARHLASASHVCVRLDASRIPCASDVTPEQALTSGEEYELLITSAQPFDSTEFAMRFGTSLTAVGEILSGPSGTVDLAGVRVAAAGGYDHFWP